jgi:chromosome segregation ATPase
MLENTQARAQIDHMEKKKAELESEMTSKDQLVAKIQSEITKNNATIKRKTDQMEQLNAKIDKMVAAAGGVELGPLEIQINSLQKSIEAENVAIAELQQSWLRDQNELVSVNRR